jgi:hypothetical protein
MADNKGGLVLLGVGGTTLLLLLMRGRKPSGNPLVAQYLAAISAATTVSTLDAIKESYQADYGSGKLTAQELATLGAAYEARYLEIAPNELLQQYLAELTAATTVNAVDAIKVRFDADYALGKFTPSEYSMLYDAYLARREELAPGDTFFEVRVVKPDAFMADPAVSVDGVIIGYGNFTRAVEPGTHTVSFQDRPGQPGPGVAYYQAPPDLVVTVADGETKIITATYTAVPLTPGDALLNSFVVMGTPPYAPGSLQTALMYMTNPTDRTIKYIVYVYPFDPTSIETPEGGALGISSPFDVGPGAQVSQYIDLTMPGTEGSYPVWVTFWEVTTWYDFLKKANTGLVLEVDIIIPGGWPIETQLASIITPVPYLMTAVVYRNGSYLYYDYPRLPVDDLQEIFPGETVQIQVLQACPLSYGGKTWHLAAGWNQIVW